VDLQLKNKIALVTGSTAGIGFAIGAGLAGEGATVIINGRTEQRVGEAIATIRQRHRAAGGPTLCPCRHSNQQPRRV
jgi:NAD(P)-dependent dehydrogenase (short-subunit alcohol dehydrogenase family)